MSTNAVPRAGQGAPPLLVLAAWLENAHNRDHIAVSFPANTSEAIVQARPLGSQYNMQEVQAIVLALERRDSITCENLDSRSLTILCSIFIYSEECLSQQRGLCLLTKALHRDERDLAQKAARKREKKVAMGQAALTLLVKGFLNAEASTKLRRWLGILALELVEECPENIRKLQSDPPHERHWQHLSEVIEHGSCQVLKLLAGSMIREMLSFDVSPDEFWPSETGLDLYSKFPKSQHHNSQWVTSFEEFVDELVLEKILTKEVSNVIFAQSVHVGALKWDLEEASAILVTLSEELNIVVPANDANPAVYIDVPFDSILEVYFDKTLAADSRKYTYGLVLRLMGGMATNCILNATRFAERNVALAFASEKAASTLRRLLMPANAGTNGVLLHSESEAIDVSEPILSDDELAATSHALSNGQILVRTASLASAIVPQENTVSTINPSMLERVRTSPHTSAEHQGPSSNSAAEVAESLQGVGRNVEMAAEGIHVAQNESWVEQAIEGIDVSQIDSLSREDMQHREGQVHILTDDSSKARVYYPQAFGEGTREPIEHFDRNLDNRRSSSLQRHKGPNAIEDVPDFRAPLLRPAVSSITQVERDESLGNQHGEHDDLYDASPQVKDGHRRSPETNPVDNTPHKLERPLESTGRQANSKTGLPVKLSRQLRNADGVVESHTEQAIDAVFSILGKSGASDVETSANSKKKRAPVAAKVRTVLKTPIKPGKKLKQRKGKATAIEGPPSASFDNYDLPPSPSPIRVDSTVQISTNKKMKNVTTTRLKATKVPHNNQKQAKSLSTSAAATTLPKGPAPHLKKLFKNKAKANGPDQNSVLSKPNGKVVDDDDTIWDVDQAQSEEGPHSPRHSRRPAKATEKQEASASKTKKTKAQTQLHTKANKPTKAQTQAPIARLAKAKPTPALLSHRRPRRTAAIKANKKIQGLEESDEIMDDEEIVTALTHSTRQASLDVPETSRNQKARDDGDDLPISRGKPLIAKHSMKDPIPDSLSPDSSDKQTPDSVSDLQTENNLEKVSSVREVPAEETPGDTRDTLQEVNSASADKTAMISLHPNHSDFPNHNILVSEDQVNSVPDRVQKVYASTIVTETASTRPHKDNAVKQGHNDLDATRSIARGDQDQIKHVLPDADRMSFEPSSQSNRIVGEIVPRALKTPTIVENQQGKSLPRSAKIAGKFLPESTAKRRDPFGAKLNASMPKPIHINAKVKSRDVPVDPNAECKGPKTPKPTEIARTSRELEARPIDILGATSFEEAKQFKNSQKQLTSALQVDGASRDLSIQTSKPAGELVWVSEIETKRRIEQVGDTSHKRLKLANQEQLEGVSAKKRAAYYPMNTPPPAVSNKPRVIAFSSSGPRNQGTRSMKKPKSPKGNGVSAPHADVADFTANQVEADFASKQEVLEIPSEYNRFDLENTADPQNKARGSPRRNQAEHVKSANAIANREATTQEHGATKRKLAPFIDDPAPWEHKQISKRQRRHIEAPSTAHNHHPKMLHDLSPAVIHDRSQRLNSQNTRVNENGSPMPFLITRSEDIAAKEHYSDEDEGKDALAEARLEEQIVLPEDDPVLSVSILPRQPLVSAVSISEPKNSAYQSFSNNSKQLPSSPHAPSVMGTMAPHHIYHDGEIVNAETKEPIIPVNPQDPFLGVTQNPHNSFMKALRKSTEAAAKRFTSVTNEQGLSGDVAMRVALAVDEDPDKTLIESSSAKKHEKVHVLVSSSSSGSRSSAQASELDESSEEESDWETEVKWRKTLEPHQENMLECLLNISHRLIRHLIDKETAIKDMVADFASRGNNLVESYEKGLQDYIVSLKANNDRRHQHLVKVFEKAQADRATTSRAVTKSHVPDMKAKWETQQEALRRTMAAALAACDE